MKLLGILSQSREYLSSICHLDKDGGMNCCIS